MNDTNGRITKLLNDDNLQEQVKIEDFLAVANGARRVASLYIPADFPQGDKVRENIDDAYSLRYYESQRQRGITGILDKVRYAAIRAFTNPLRYKASLLREAFEESVWDHPNYDATRDWADDFGLHIFEHQIRPSLDEMFVIGDKRTVSEVAALMVRRDEIRREVIQNMRQSGTRQMMFLPEETSPEYLKKMGNLLGYPDCCIDSYIDDVSNSIDSALRLSTQLSELKEEEEEVTPTAFFAGSFFPCKPDCEAARSMGENIVESVSDMDERLRERTFRVFRANMDYVERYPEILERRRKQMMSQYMGGVPGEE